MATNNYPAVLVYAADGAVIELRKKLLPENFSAYWYNPRTGRWSEEKEISDKKPIARTEFSENKKKVIFNPLGKPAFDNDWILLIE